MASRDPAVLSLTRVTRSFGSRQVLCPLSLTIAPGTVLGLLGPNGAGKTTLMSVMSGLLAPSSGSVALAGTEVRSTRDARAAQRVLGYLPQHPQWLPSFTALETVEYAAWTKGVPRARRRATCLEALERVHLADVASRRMKTLSGGMVQRTMLASVIVSRPRLLLLDEPTVGLDPAQRIEFRQLVSELAEAAVILSTHLVEDVAVLADQVLVLDHGRERFRGTVAELKERAAPDAPGDSVLERAYMSVLADDPDQGGHSHG